MPPPKKQLNVTCVDSRGRGRTYRIPCGSDTGEQVLGPNVQQVFVGRVVSWLLV